MDQSARCPFNSARPASEELSACPGYRPEALSFAGGGPGQNLPDRMTCAHLSPEPSARGFLAACHHPVRPQLLQVVARMQRSYMSLPWAHWDAHAAVISTDEVGLVTRWNATAESLYGWRREEVWGRDITEFIVGPSDRELARAIVAALGRGEPWRGEFNVRRKTGEAVAVEVADMPLLAGDGAVVGIVGLSAPAGTLTDAQWEGLLAGYPGAVGGRR